VAGRAFGLYKMGEWWWWALVSPDGVAPSQMVGVSASVDLPLHHEVQKFSSGTGSPGWSRKKGCKWLWCGGGLATDGCWQLHNFMSYGLQNIDKSLSKITTFPYFSSI